MYSSRILPILAFLATISCPTLSNAAGGDSQPALFSSDPAPRGGVTSSTAKGPLTDGETPSSPDPRLDYEPSCQPLSDALRNNSKLGTGRLDSDVQFAALRDARQNAVRALQQASSRRELLKNYLDERRRERNYRNEPRIMSSSVGRTIDDLRKDLIDLGSQADSLTRQIDNAKQPDIAEALRGKLDDIRRKATQTKVDLEIGEERLKASAERARREQNAAIELNNSITRNESAVQAATTDIECLTALQNKIDADIYSALIPETQKNQFKLWMSGLFALMVLVVILGFFTVALRDAAIRAAIFSNQTGIQFVTLFSLVIAIILFGITEILQAKELSALLGGISGYILGRVTTDRSTAPTAASSRPNGAVKAKTVEFAVPNLIKNSAGGFEIFTVNSRIRVKGSAANSGDYSVTSVSSTELTLAEHSIKPEPAGATITVTAL